MARITVIETGQVPQKYRERHGSFPEMFERMVRAEDPAATVEIVSIPNGDALPDPRKLEAILITGAAAGVYDRARLDRAAGRLCSLRLREQDTDGRRLLRPPTDRAGARRHRAQVG